MRRWLLGVQRREIVFVGSRLGFGLLLVNESVSGCCRRLRGRLIGSVSESGCVRDDVRCRERERERKLLTLSCLLSISRPRTGERMSVSPGWPTLGEARIFPAPPRPVDFCWCSVGHSLSDFYAHSDQTRIHLRMRLFHERRIVWTVGLSLCR